MKGPNRNYQIYDPLDFLAAVTAHIPDRREHFFRYYGWYSSVQRGKRRKLGLEEKPPEAPPIEDDTAEARAARRAWARLIKKICEVDPLICPECSGPMRVIAFIEEEDVIGQILEYLNLWVEPEPRPPPAVPEQVDIQYALFFDSQFPPDARAGEWCARRRGEPPLMARFSSLDRSPGLSGPGGLW